MLTNKSAARWGQFVICAVVVAALTAFPRAAAAYDPSLSRWAGLCAQSEGHGAGCGKIPKSSVDAYRPEQEAIDLLLQERRRQEDEARQRRQRAEREDLNGVAAESRGDLRSAANSFIEALNIDPGNRTIRAHLDRVTNKMQNVTATAEIRRVVEAAQGQIASARIAAMTDKMRVDATTNRLTALYHRLAVDARRTPVRSSQTLVRVGNHVYRPSGNALIGGMVWLAGYNVQNTDPAIVAKSRLMLRQQMPWAKMPYSESIDPSRYNFVLGIASSTSELKDLSNRVIFDEYSKGQYSAKNQALYNSLKGRQFNHLDCHSNGAMVCLAALTNQDVIAERVVLYGPQITIEALKMWNEMVRTHKVKSVEIIVNQGDPVPPLSLLVGGGAPTAMMMSSLAMLQPPTFVRVIHETAPQLSVRTFSCSRSLTLSCHTMTTYKADVCRARPSSGRIVPGTGIPGRINSGLIEPPSPC